MKLHPMQMTKRAAFLGAALLLSAPQIDAQSASTAQDGKAPVTLTLPQTRALAAQAIQDKKPEIAIYLAKGLIKANPKSPIAHYILARASEQKGDLKNARKSAARSYRYSLNKGQRFQAAELAAKLAYADDSLTMAQLWVRRTAQNTNNAQVEQQLGSDFRRIRSQNPLSFSLSGSIRLCLVPRRR